MRDRRNKFQEFADCPEPTFVLLKYAPTFFIKRSNIKLLLRGKTSQKKPFELHFLFAKIGIVIKVKPFYRPTSQSLICDMNLIVERSGLTVTAEDRAWLMNKLLNLTQPTMCIDPNPVVSVVSRKTHSMQYKLATTNVKKALKKFTPSSVNRKRKLDQVSIFDVSNRLNVLIYHFLTK
jgi:hypothetical protein